MLRINRSGEYVVMSGAGYAFEEFARVLRNCILKGKPHDKIICRLASKCDVAVKKDMSTISFRMDHVDKHMGVILKEVIPGNFVELKFKEVPTLDNIQETLGNDDFEVNHIYGVTGNMKVESYFIAFDIFKNLKAKYKTKEVDLPSSALNL